MYQENQDDLRTRVAELEQKLDTSLHIISKLVKAVDYMRCSDSRFIFEMDLVKHSLCEAGYTDDSSDEGQS